jgi:hypothetical protein
MDNWSKIEVELIVADYFQMLSDELIGKTYIKAEHRKKLLPLLNNRSEGSIEFKYQNISAVLINLGQPYIKGYLPRFNYQKILEESVISYLSRNISIEDKFKIFAEKEITIEPKANFEKLLVEPPQVDYAADPSIFYKKNPIKINYLEKEQSNAKLGRLGEVLVLQYEKWKLVLVGKEKLAEEIRWISKEEGDGAGFDILSKNINGTDKYIEVKTTKLGKETPFYFTQNELSFSCNHRDSFHLFRLFNFDNDAKMFTKNGSLDQICHSTPITYKGYF